MARYEAHVAQAVVVPTLPWQRLDYVVICSEIEQPYWQRVAETVWAGRNCYVIAEEAEHHLYQVLLAAQGGTVIFAEVDGIAPKRASAACQFLAQHPRYNVYVAVRETAPNDYIPPLRLPKEVIRRVVTEHITMPEYEDNDFVTPVGGSTIDVSFCNMCKAIDERCSSLAFARETARILLPTEVAAVSDTSEVTLGSVIMEARRRDIIDPFNVRPLYDYLSSSPDSSAKLALPVVNRYMVKWTELPEALLIPEYNRPLVPAGIPGRVVAHAFQKRSAQPDQTMP